MNKNPIHSDPFVLDESDLDLIVDHRPDPEIIALTNWPAEVRGFGPVLAAAAEKAAGRRSELRRQIT